MKRYCLALDLKDDPDLISAYKEYHKHVWSEVSKSIFDSGILDLQIYSIENRLFMIMEVNASFSFEKKEKLEKVNPRVKAWEALMWKFQEPLPNAKPNEKWVLMEKICDLKKD